LGFCDDKLACPLANLTQRWEDWTLFRWCKECDNQRADICLRYWTEEYQAENYNLEEPFVTGLLIGMGSSLLLAILVYFFCSSNRRKGEEVPVIHTQKQESALPAIKDQNQEDSGLPACVEMTDTIEVSGVSGKEPVMA
jgi:hypothetical protein